MRYKKILLVDPVSELSEKANPIPILDMAPYIRKKGGEVDVCRIIDLPPPKKYDIIGISCIGEVYSKIINEKIKVLKTSFPQTKIVLGGKWSTTMLPEDRKMLEDLGVETVTARGELFFTDDKEIDFDNYPSWDKKDFDILYQATHVMSMRGCPFNCNFCNNTEKKLSYFSAKRTVDNIELVLEKTHEVFICDDVFVANYAHAKAVYDECKKRNIYIENKSRFFVHLNTINEKTLEIIDLFKPFWVEVGIESGDDRILKLMDKKITAQKIRDTIPLLAKHTKVVGLWIVGYPYETIESLENSYKLLLDLKDYFLSTWVSFYMPLFGTVGYFMSKECGGVFSSDHKTNSNLNYIPKGLTGEILIEYRTKMLIDNQKTIDNQKKPNKIINSIALGIPVKKWRDSFRNSFLK